MIEATLDLDSLSAGDELDAIVADVVFGGDSPPLRYSTDISAAWKVRERMQQLGWDSQDHQTQYDGQPTSYMFRFSRWRDERGNYYMAPSKYSGEPLAQPLEEQYEVGGLGEAPLAICKAAIAALRPDAR